MQTDSSFLTSNTFLILLIAIVCLLFINFLFMIGLFIVKNKENKHNKAFEEQKTKENHEFVILNQKNQVIETVYQIQNLLSQALTTFSNQNAKNGEEQFQFLRQEVNVSNKNTREELLSNLVKFQQMLTQQHTQSTQTQNSQLDAMAQQVAVLERTLAQTLSLQLQNLSEANARRMVDIQQTLQTQLQQLQNNNNLKLDEMRNTVDEKLQTTLQTRLSESFQQVAQRLEQVHKGLGEMQSLAQGVGDLKHLLTNVKVRGIFGEAQLEALLEQALSSEQYSAQVKVLPNGKNMVDFAVKLPGKGEYDSHIWLPIDAKFPSEDYERLLSAQQQADKQASELAGKALEQRIRIEAKSIREKYIVPPHTTDFAILFLPTEGLYAEVLRRDGLMQQVQSEFQVVLAGPTTLLAILSSLRMGFRTLALEKRSSEVWQILAAVKTEFEKFGDVLAKVKAQTQTVLNTLESAETRSRAMQRRLKNVETLPSETAQEVLGLDISKLK